MQVQLTNGLAVTIVPPTGMALIRAQAWFGVRFAHLQKLPPSDQQGAERAIRRIAQALMPYVRDVTVEQLVEAFLANPYDMALVVQPLFSRLAYVSRKQRRS